MSQAKQAHNTTRRTFLAGVPAAVALAALPAVALAAQPHPDALLFELDAELEAGIAAEKAADDGSENSTDEFARIYEANYILTRRMAGTPAKTLEGLRIKARSLRWGCDLTPEKIGRIGDCSTQGIFGSVFADLLRMGGDVL